MTTPARRHALLRGVTAIIAAGTLVGGLAACSGGSSPAPAASIPATGTDDGSSLTLWTRAPLEKQAKLLVAAYNASHKNQVQLTVVPNDDYVAKVTQSVETLVRERWIFPEDGAEILAEAETAAIP